MPTVFTEQGLRFVIYTDDHAPPHVHVEGPGKRAKISLDLQPQVIWKRRVTKTDMKRALNAIRSNRTLLLEVWEHYHG